MQKVTLRKLVRRSTVLLALRIAAIGAQSAAAGQQHQPGDPVLFEGNPKCTEIGYESGFKPDFGATGQTPPIGGPVTLGDGQISATIEVTGTNTDGEATVISWTSTIAVDAVIVKGGNSGFSYVYTPAAFSGSGLTTPTNNGGNQPEISHIEFCYSTKGGDLTIKKTAETRSYLEYDWSIDKTVDHEELAVVKDPTATATYVISVKRGEATEHSWQVLGEITVTNNTDSIAKITSVTDELSDYGAVTVHCDAPQFPVELNAGATLTCSYGPISLPNGNARENTAKVTTAADGKVGGASQTVPVKFGDPMVVNAEVTAIDDNATHTYEDDDMWWTFTDGGSAKYQTSYWCKDAGEHTNTVRLFNDLARSNLNIPDDAEPPVKSATATVLVHCDTKTTAPNGGKNDGAGVNAPTQPLGPQLASAVSISVDGSCQGADAARGSRGDSAWGLIGPKGLRTKFYLSKRSHWKVLKLGNKANNPYFRLGAAYIMAKLHRLNGTPSRPGVEKSMNWARRYMATHRPAFSKPAPRMSTGRRVAVRKVRKVIDAHARKLQNYADQMDAARCTT